MILYDLVVIGSGSGGISAAVTAAGFGKKVLLIDKNKPGGECTWSGCVPSKALIHKAKRIHILKQEIKGYTYDSKNALDHIHAVRENIYSHETPEVFSQLGIDYLQGEAHFKDSETITVKEKMIQGKKIIISTGSSPFIPPIKGLDSVPYLTNENLFELGRFPKSLIILGGGSIGIELAQALNRLGTTVELVEMAPVPLFREEEEFSLAIEKHLSEEGVKIHLRAKANEVSRSGDKINLRFEQDGKEQTIESEALLLAVGRQANIHGLGLDNAGINYTPKGIEVNAYLQTSSRRIYAIGDVVGPYQFSHMANVQGILAAQNAILPFKRKMHYDHVAWVTFTDPEIARAGKTEALARKSHGDSIRIYDYDFNRLDRAMTGGKTIERIKVILDKKARILGVSILANRAGELIGEAQLLKSRRIKFSKLSSVIHPYPTYSEVYSKIGKKVLVDNILEHRLVKLFKKRQN